MAETVLELLGKFTLDSSSFNAALEAIQKAVQNTVDKMGQLSDKLDKQLEKSTKKMGNETAQKMQESLTKVGSVVQNIGSGLSAVGKTISATVTAPIAGLGIATAKTALDFSKLKENTKIAFKVLLGDGEKAETMLNDLHTFAKTTPFSYDSYLVAGKQLVAMGVSAKDTIPYLEGITNASIATGAGQEGIQTLSNAIGRMSSKGKVQLEELNQMIGMGIPAVKILGNAYGVSEQEVYKMMSSGKLLAEDALPKLLDGMNKGTEGVNGSTAAYGGLAKEMKNTMGGALDSLKSKFRNLSLEIWDSEESYPELQEIIRSFTSVLDVLPKVFKSISTAVAPVLKVVNERLQEFGKFLKNASPETLEKIGKAILGLAAAGPIIAIIGKITSAIGGFISSIGTITGALGQLSIGFGPLAAIVLGVASVFVFLAAEWDKVVKVFTGWLERTGFMKSLGTMFERFGVIKDVMYTVGGIITALLIPNFAYFAGVINGAVNAINGILKVLGGAVKVIQGFANLIIGIFTFDKDKILSSFGQLWDGIKDIFSGALEAIGGWISGFFTGWTGFFGGLFDGLSGSAIPEVERFSEGVSENTQKAVGAFMDLEEEATKNLNQLNWSGQAVTKEMADKIVGNFDEMTKSITAAIDEQKTKTTDTLNEMFAASTTLSDEEKNRILTNATAGFDEKARITTEGNARIKEIMTTADAENRELTQQESDEINRIKTEMMNTAVVTMSQSEAEQNAIFERLKINATALSAQQAAEVVQNSLTQKEATVKEAEDEYNKRLAVAAQLRAQGTEEAQKAADAIVEEATRQKDETVKKAEETHQKIVDEAKNQAGEHVGEVNWETGEVKSGWDKFKENIGTTWENIKNGASTGWNNVSTAISNKVEDAKKAVGKTWETLSTNCSNTWDSVKKTAGETWGKVKDGIGNAIKGAWDKVNEWIGKILGLFDFKWELPKLKLPHFKISGSFSLNPLSVPSFGIDWYAKGAVLEAPTIFALNPETGKAMGGGEAGPEAVAPIDVLQSYVSDAVIENNNSDLISEIYNLLSRYLPGINNQKLVLDTGALVGEITPNIDYNLGDLNVMKARGN